MDDDNENEQPGYGTFNHLWMLKTALFHAPHMWLLEGVYAMLEYLAEAPDGEELDIAKAFDILGQVSLTLVYRDPEESARLTDEDARQRFTEMMDRLGELDDEKGKEGNGEA